MRNRSNNRAPFVLRTASAVIVTAVCIFSCGTEENRSQETYAIVTAASTQMRISPMVFAGIVAELSQGEGVLVLKRSEGRTWVGKTQDYWYHVKTKSGLTGWVFGPNLSLKSGDAKDLEKISSDFMKIEEARLKTNIAGKWWSTNEFGDFTDHCLEIYNSGKYRSYMKGSEDTQLIGTYQVDFTKNEIVFSHGTSFRSNLDFARRGNDFILKKRMKDFDLRFTKISIETSPEPDIPKKDIKPPPPQKTETR